MMASSSSGRAKVTEPPASRNVAFNRPSSSRTTASADASATASSSYAGHTRRHSLFGTEDRVVLDIGSKYARFGFSGEPRPRAIVSSVSISQPSTSFSHLNSFDSSQDCLWDLDFQRCQSDVLRKEREALLLAQLTQLIRTAYSRYLMVDSKQRKVFIVENPLMPTLIKDMLCKILFDSLQVPSVSFVSAPLLSMVAVGKITGLVIDVGYLQSTVTPVYYGRPLLSHLASSPRAGRRLNERLKALLVRHAKYIEAQQSLQSSDIPLKQRIKKVQESILTEQTLEEIKVKALFVGTYPPPAPEMATETEEISSQYRRYAQHSQTTPFTFAISPDSIDPDNAAPLLQRLDLGPSDTMSALDSTSGTFARGVIAIPGWVRERAAELLFESEDSDEDDTVHLALRVISSLPIDLRRTMCENVLVTGGTVMLPGFANRFRKQLTSAVKQAELPGGSLSISKLVPLQRQEPSSSGQFPLHSAVCVLNDPWPDTVITKTGAGSGCAPAFAANLLAWIGASLTGVLKTTSLSEISREAYDQAFASALAAKSDKPYAEATTTDNAGASSIQRPPVRGTGNRGSFVGVVGGLETGAFGGLAAVSRHLVGVDSRSDPISPERAIASRASTTTKE